MSHQPTESEASPETNRSGASSGSGHADRSSASNERDPGEESASRKPAVQPCLACGRSFPLVPAHHDGYGPVCPHCGCLI